MVTHLEQGPRGHLGAFLRLISSAASDEEEGRCSGRQAFEQLAPATETARSAYDLPVALQSQAAAVMSREDDDWHSDVMDDDGNYYQDGGSYRLPETVSRGSAPQRLNMKHGFMKHIVSGIRESKCFQ